MEKEVNFDVFQFVGPLVKRVQFAIPGKDLSFNNFVKRIVKECVPENGRLDFNLLSILYVNLEGDQVPLKWDEDEYCKFLDFVRQSQQYGYKYIHLIIPNFEIEKSKFDHISFSPVRGENVNVLSTQEFKDLFSMEIDARKFFNNAEDLHTSFANIFLTQPRFPSTTEYQEQSSEREKMFRSYGMLDVKRVSKDDLPRLLADGSKMLVPTEDDNYLLMSFSKNKTHAPYNSTVWQHGHQDEPNFPIYRCQHVRFPACVENDGIQVSHESKNIIGNLREFEQKMVGKRTQKSEQRPFCQITPQMLTRKCANGRSRLWSWRSKDTCIQSQHVSQPGVIERPTRFQQLFKKSQSENNVPLLVDESECIYEKKLRAKFRRLIKKNENNVPLLVESNCNHEDELRAGFHRHMEKNENNVPLLVESNRNHKDDLRAKLLRLKKKNENNVPLSVESNRNHEDEHRARFHRHMEKNENNAPLSVKLNRNHREQIRAGFHRHMEKNENNMLLVESNRNRKEKIRAEFQRHFEKVSAELIASGMLGPPNTGHDTSLENEKTTRECSSKDRVPERVAKETIEDDWEIVKGLTNDETDQNSAAKATAHCNDRLTETETSSSDGDGVFWDGSEGSDWECIESEKTQPLDILPDKASEMASNVLKNGSVKIPKEFPPNIFEQVMLDMYGTIPMPLEDSNVPK